MVNRMDLLSDMFRPSLCMEELLVAETVKWRDEIAKGVAIRQRLKELDKGPLWSYPFPRIAARPEDVALVEKALSVPLGPKYSEFLQWADGWPKFFQGVDLFGTTELRVLARRLGGVG